MRPSRNGGQLRGRSLPPSGRLTWGFEPSKPGVASKQGFGPRLPDVVSAKQLQAHSPAVMCFPSQPGWPPPPSCKSHPGCLTQGLWTQRDCGCRLHARRTRCALDAAAQPTVLVAANGDARPMGGFPELAEAASAVVVIPERHQLRDEEAPLTALAVGTALRGVLGARGHL